MQNQQSSNSNRPRQEIDRSNVRSFPAPESSIANPFEQVNKFDLAQWNQIVGDIAKPEVAMAVIRVMEQREPLQAMFPSIYVRAHETCIKFEQQSQRRAKRIAMAKDALVHAIALIRTAGVRIWYGAARLVMFCQARGSTQKQLF